MSKLVLNDVSSGFASVTLINANSTATEIAFENTLSRDGTSPNHMEAPLDMNGNLILNQANPITVSGFTWEGPWVTAMSYQVGDVVEESSASYIAIVAHTSGVFATDLSSGKWQIVAASAGLPAQAGQAGKYLTTDGFSESWGGVISPFSQTYLDDTDAASVRATLEVQPTASPAFTGIPTAPTAAPLTNTTQLATTAFVQAAVPTDPNFQTINGGTIRGPGNPIVNGAFDIWQLGTTFVAGPHLQKNADRWNYDFNGTVGTASIAREEVARGSIAGDFHPKYYLRFNQTVAGAGNTFQDISTQIEGVDTLNGQEVTISFYATYISGSAPTLTAIKTEQYFGSGGSPSAPVFTTSAAVPLVVGANVWRKYSITTTLASTTGKTLGSNVDNTLNIIFTLPLNQVFDFAFTCVQIEPGPLATNFHYRPISQTMMDCQRYLQTSYDDGVAPGTVTDTGIAALTTFTGTSLFTIPMRVPMRSFPSVTFYNPSTGATGTWNQAGTPLAVSTNTGGHNNLTVAVAGGTSGIFCSGHYVMQDPLI